MEINLTIKCRGCLAEEPEMHNLFHLLTDDLTLANILSETTSTQVDESEEISPYLCLKCTKIIVDFYNFKVDFVKSLRYFQNQLKELVEDPLARASIPKEATITKHIILIDESEDLASDNLNDINEDLLEQLESGGTFECGNEVDYYKNVPPLTQIIGSHEETTRQVILDDSRLEENKQVKPEVGEFTVQNELVQLIESIVFCCRKCDKEYLSKDDFLQHMIGEHEIIRIDASKFTKKTLMKLPLGNIKVENFDSDFKLEEGNIKQKLCKVCKTLVLKTEYESHYDEHKVLVCDCGAKFARKKNLVAHQMSVHSVERQFVCQYCSKAFKLKQTLTKHLKYHTHPRSEMCHMCGKLFNDKSVLNTHIQLKHFPARDFQCNHCGLNFPLKSTLFKHIRRHHTTNRERTFSCVMCNMTYFEKATLNRHISMKHSDQPIKVKCEYCGKNFTTKGNLYKHLRTSHCTLDHHYTIH